MLPILSRFFSSELWFVMADTFLFRLRSRFVLPFWVGVTFLFSGVPTWCVAGEDEMRPSSLAPLLQARIDSYHKDAEPNGEALRLVYFHPADKGPQRDFRRRLDGIARDFQEFFYRQVNAQGFSVKRIPLEMEDVPGKEGEQRVRLHVVRGADVNDAYGYESSGKIRKECQVALKGVVDFESDFVLMFCGLCDRIGDNQYVVHSPYYGDGSSNHMRGLCYAADVDILDIENLSDTRTHMRYEEHSGKFRRTVAGFNSLYIGGIVHELGHGLGLPHNRELPSERSAIGNALMGTGNATYRNEVWSNRKGSFLTLSSSLRLAVHPLFTGSDRGRERKSSVQFTDLRFRADEKKLRIEGTVKTQPHPVAIIAYSDPVGGGDYDAFSWVSEVDKNGKFDVSVTHHAKSGGHVLRLTTVCPNGAAIATSFPYSVDPDLRPQVTLLRSRVILKPILAAYTSNDITRTRALVNAALAETNPESRPDEQTRSKLQYLLQLMDSRSSSQSLADARGKRVFLSDYQPTSVQVGWGPPLRNECFYDRSVFFELDGHFYPKGFSAHAPSRIQYALDGKWKTFTAMVGLQDRSRDTAEVIFEVVGDGESLFRSDPVRVGRPMRVTVDVAGVKQMELIAESTRAGNGGCWSVWAGPELSRDKPEE